MRSQVDRQTLNDGSADAEAAALENITVCIHIDWAGHYTCQWCGQCFFVKGRKYPVNAPEPASGNYEIIFYTLKSDCYIFSHDGDIMPAMAPIKNQKALKAYRIVESGRAHAIV